jgi:tetrahydromethanopterin S-methyltransferase subunit G
MTAFSELQHHIEMCDLRYANLDARINKIEAKLDQIETKIDNFKTDIAWMLIKGGASIIVFLLGAIATILKVLGHF